MNQKKTENKMIIAGNKIYGTCPVCYKFIQINKPVVGSLHVCNTEDEDVYLNELIDLQDDYIKHHKERHEE